MKDTDTSLGGQATLNGKDLWTEYHAFLREERKGGRDNLSALLSPAKAKGHVSVNIREEEGEKYSQALDTKSEGRDVTLHIAVYAPTAAAFVTRYKALLTALRTGSDGWLTLGFPTLGLTMKVFVKEFPDRFSALSDLWHEGEQCGAFKVTFREPVPSF